MNDFDFFTGTWNVRNRWRTDFLDQTSEWEEFPGKRTGTLFPPVVGRFSNGRYQLGHGNHAVTGVAGHSSGSADVVQLGWGFARTVRTPRAMAIVSDSSCGPVGSGADPGWLMLTLTVRSALRDRT
jgi:hypothetical protein